MRFKITYLLVALFLLGSFSCSKSNEPEEDAIAATLYDYTGLDGCSWVLKVSNDEVLEPVNLGDFLFFELMDGKKVWIKYHTTGKGSICMVGPTVELEAIWER